jgi:hypothetical protein
MKVLLGQPTQQKSASEQRKAAGYKIIPEIDFSD